MKQIFLIFSIVLLLNSCDNADSDQSNMQYSLIAQDDSLPTEGKPFSKSNLVINDIQNWNSLMAKMNAVNNLTKDFKETNIDFTKYQIIAVIDDVQTSGGHSIDITAITENENTLTVKIEKLKKGNAATVMSQPFHIVKISKTEKQIVFK